MNSFADLFETVTPASTSDAERNLTTLAAVKASLKISTSDTDALIGDQIPRVSQLITDYCRLAKDAAGGKPTFARETLRATWYVQDGHDCRGTDLYLPWRLPLASVDSVVEGGIALVAGTDYVVTGARPAKLRRLAAEAPVHWGAGTIVVTFKAGFAATMSGNVDDAIEAAAIEQMASMVFGAGRDPLVRSETATNVGSVTYSAPSGDTLGDITVSNLLPSVRSMLAPWRNPAP